MNKFALTGLVLLLAIGACFVDGVANDTLKSTTLKTSTVLTPVSSTTSTQILPENVTVTTNNKTALITDSPSNQTSTYSSIAASLKTSPIATTKIYTTIQQTTTQESTTQPTTANTTTYTLLTTLSTEHAAQTSPSITTSQPVVTTVTNQTAKSVTTSSTVALNATEEAQDPRTGLSPVLAAVVGISCALVLAMCVFLVFKFIKNSKMFRFSRLHEVPMDDFDDFGVYAQHTVPFRNDL